MDGLSERSAASLTIGITYTAYNFEHCGHTIVEYSNDLLIQHRAIGREIPRKAINLAFEANVKDIYAEGSVMRQELLEQINCPIASNYWEKYRRPAAFLVYMKDDVTPYGVLPRSSDEVSRKISTLLGEDNIRIEVPYLGLRDLRQLRYMDIVSKVRISWLGRDAGNAPQATMADVWKTVVMNIFWFEDSKLKAEKLAETYSDEVRRYWKLIEYADFVKSNPSARHMAPIDYDNNIEITTEEGRITPVNANPQSRIPAVMGPIESSVTASIVCRCRFTTLEDEGYSPSMAAQTAHAQPHVSHDNSENSRLRMAVIEHKATIRDLSARLVKVKQNEAQDRKHSAREVRSSPTEVSEGQKSELSIKILPRAFPANQPSVPTLHDRNLTPINTIPHLPHPLNPGATLTPPRQHVQDFHQLEQQQGHHYVLESQVEQHHLLAGRGSEQRYIHAFDAQLAQVDLQKGRQ